MDASTLSVPTSAIWALPESSTRIALESPVTTTSSISRSPSHCFFCATYKGSENVVAGPGNAILILAANALGQSHGINARAIRSPVRTLQRYGNIGALQWNPNVTWIGRNLQGF